MDEEVRLRHGKWTSDGRKLLRFYITEIAVTNYCGLNESANEAVSGLSYFMEGKGKGNSNARIFIDKWIKRVACNEAEEADGFIGTCFFFQNDDDEKEAQIEIALQPEAFDNFIHAIAVFDFEGELTFQVIVKKKPGEQTLDDDDTDDVLIVDSYEMGNTLPDS